MGILVNNTDFVGRYHLASNPLEVANINAYIEEFEKKYIYKILGIELGNLFIADVTIGFIPANVDFLKIYNELAYEDGCEQLHSLGLKKTLLGFIYFHILTEGRLTPSPMNGVGKNKVELKDTSTSRTEIYNRFNESVDSVTAIQRFCCINSDLYPTFKGQKLLFNW